MYHFKKDVYNPLIIFSKGLAKWIFSSGSYTELMKHFSGTASVSRRVSDLFFGFEDFRPLLCGFKPFKESIMEKLCIKSSWRWNPESFFFPLPLPAVLCRCAASFLPHQILRLGNGDPAQTLDLPVAVFVTLRNCFPSAQTFLFLVEWLCFQLLVWDLWPKYYVWVAADLFIS